MRGVGVAGGVASTGRRALPGTGFLLPSGSTPKMTKEACWSSCSSINSGLHFQLQIPRPLFILQDAATSLPPQNKM